MAQDEIAAHSRGEGKVTIAFSISAGGAYNRFAEIIDSSIVAEDAAAKSPH